MAKVLVRFGNTPVVRTRTGTAARPVIRPFGPPSPARREKAASLPQFPAPTKAMRMLFVAPGEPNGTPATQMTRSPIWRCMRRA